MLGELVSRVLALLLGYGYPAFETFKTLEASQVEFGRLRFWGQYWTIIGIVTIIEWFSDIFISWLPMYGEAKLAFFIYLWHPKTMGTIMVYEAFLRPLVVKHEPDIEQRLRRFRAKFGDLLLFYIKNFTEKGHSFFLDMIHYMISRSRSSGSSTSTETSTKEGVKPSRKPITIRRTETTEADECAAVVEEFRRFAGEEETPRIDFRRSRPKHKK